MSKSTIALILVAVLATASAIYSWYKPPQIVTQTQYVPFPEEKIVTKTKKVEVPGPERIITIEKKVIVDKLGLPSWINDDENKQVIANADVPCDNSISGYSMVAILDTKSGEGKIIGKSKPLPFMSLLSEREAGVRYGVSTTNPTQIDVYVKWDFARIGAIRLGAYGEANSNSEAKAMFAVGYGW